MNVILSASGYRQSQWMLEEHVRPEGGVLRNVPGITWMDSRLHVLPGHRRDMGWEYILAGGPREE